MVKEKMIRSRKSLDGVPMSKSEIAAQSGFEFDSAVPQKDRARIRRTIRSSFTQDETSKIKGKNKLIISTGSVDPEHSGVYYRKTRRSPAVAIIEDPSNDDTIVHEITHHLRLIDESRSGTSKAISKVPQDPKRFRDLHNSEEAATVAEAAIRTKSPTKTVSGYYGDVPEVKAGKKTPTSAYKEDRKILTSGTNKQTVGKAAIKSVNENFSKTNISKKKLGNIQAINSLKNLINYNKGGKSIGRKSEKRSRSRKKC